jgi:hypothetical protein
MELFYATTIITLGNREKTPFGSPHGYTALSLKTLLHSYTKSPREGNGTPRILSSMVVGYQRSTCPHKSKLAEQLLPVTDGRVEA